MAVSVRQAWPSMAPTLLAGWAAARAEIGIVPCGSSRAPAADCGEHLGERRRRAAARGRSWREDAPGVGVDDHVGLGLAARSSWWTTDGRSRHRPPTGLSRREHQQAGEQGRRAPPRSRPPPRARRPGDGAAPLPTGATRDGRSRAPVRPSPTTRPGDDGADTGDACARRPPPRPPQAPGRPGRPLRGALPRLPRRPPRLDRRRRAVQPRRRRAGHAAELASVTRPGPAAIGLVLALVVAVGIRSGGRGGPLALAAADVRHVLLRRSTGPSRCAGRRSASCARRASSARSSAASPASTPATGCPVAALEWVVAGRASAS